MEQYWIEEPLLTSSGYAKKFAHSSGCLSENTVFCFKHIDKEYNTDNLCSRKTDNKLQKAFIQKIEKLSKMTIADIQSSDKSSFGFEMLKVERLKKTIPNSIAKDVEKVHIFRFGGKGRMIGFYNRNIFHIIFIDPHLKLYDHGE